MSNTIRFIIYINDENHIAVQYEEIFGNVELKDKIFNLFSDRVHQAYHKNTKIRKKNLLNFPIIEFLSSLEKLLNEYGYCHMGGMIQPQDDDKISIIVHMSDITQGDNNG